MLNKSQYRLTIVLIALSVLVFTGIYSFAAESGRATVSFKGSDSQLINGNVSKSNGNIEFGGSNSTVPVPYESFDRNNYWVSDSWTNGAPPAPSAPGEEAAFRTNCHPSHLGYVDPIVKPGQNGASHLHMFFGNRNTTFSSTDSSLKNTGGGSCDGGPLNRTAYWIPALNDGTGNVLLPLTTIVYYKVDGRNTSNSTLRSMPDGLRMVAGNAMAMEQQTKNYEFYKFVCVADDGNGATIYDNQYLIGNCPSGSRLYFHLFFPQCWDGKNLDSTDHKSHLTYLDWGSTSCPSDHPVLLPQVSLHMSWKTGSAGTSKWYLSSDDMTSMGMGKVAGGMTAHADWFMAWDTEVKETWFANCTKKVLSCNGGQTGDGRNLKRVALEYPGPSTVSVPTDKTKLTYLLNSGV